MYTDWKKIPLFASDMIVYTENPEESTNTNTYTILMSNYSSVSGFKSNILKSIAFPYINNNVVES